MFEFDDNNINALYDNETCSHDLVTELQRLPQLHIMVVFLDTHYQKIIKNTLGQTNDKIY